MLVLASVQQIGAALLRVTMAGIPVCVSARNANDVLNTTNWFLVGPEQVVVDGVRTVSGDPHSYDLVLEEPAITGTWTLTAGDIRNVDDESLARQSVTFEAGVDFFTNPRDQQTGEDGVRLGLRGLGGPGWDAIGAALGRGDEIVRQTARAAFRQLFMPTAGGTFLESLTSSLGVDRPPDVGLSDDALRTLGMALNANRVNDVSLEAILEAYYGIGATRVSAASAPGPYVLQAGDVMVADIDGQVIAFEIQSTDAANLGAVRVPEVVALLNRTLADAGLRAQAAQTVDAGGSAVVTLYSGVPGLRSRMAFLGGTLWRALGFPGSVPTTQAAGTQWDLTVGTGIRDGIARLTWTAGPDPGLQFVFTTDIVTIAGPAFLPANRGIFTVTATTSTYFEYALAGAPAVAQGAIVLAAASDLFWTRPHVLNPDPRLYATVCRVAPDFADIRLPATTAGVTRSQASAWYLNGRPGISATGSRALTSSIVILTTATPHGLLVNDYAWLDDVIVNPVATPNYVFTPEISIGVTMTAVTKLFDDRMIILDTSLNYGIYDPLSHIFDTGLSTGFTPGSGQIGMAVMADGRVLAVFGTETRIFDPLSNTWLTAAACPRTKADTAGTVIRMADGRVMAIGTDGATGVWSNIYDPITNSWSDELHVFAGINAVNQKAVVTPDGHVVLLGGTGQLWFNFYNVFENTWHQIVGPNLGTTVRPSAIFVPRGAGEIWVAAPASAVSPGTKFDILTPATMTWRLRPTAQTYVRAALLLRGTEIYLIPNLGSSSHWEVHDFGLPDVVGTRIPAHPSQSITGATDQPFTASFADGTIGAFWPSISDLIPFYLLYAPGFANTSSGRLDGLFRVTAAPNSLTVSLDTRYHGAATISGTLTPVLPGSLASGYILDPRAGVALTAIQTTLTSTEPRGLTTSLFTVASTAGFPDEPGYICLNFGFATQSTVLQYLGVSSGTQLRIASNQLLTTDYGPGSTVCLLAGRTPFAPDPADASRASYLTGTAAGRLAAADLLQKTVAAGTDVRTTVVYPGDRGLGGAGQPTHGVEKLSDIVAVLGGDALDTELQEARLE